jgi:CDP-diglyceride synthetase
MLYIARMMNHLLHLAAILLLLGVANGAPIFARRIFQQRFSTPLDNGWHFVDGRPLFGPAKTLRGIIVSVAATAAASPLVGFSWVTGAGLASAAMLGDLLSSFTKRRLNRPPHSQALGLDQIPESLLPLLLLHRALGLNLWDMLGIVVAFIILELWLSRLLFRLHIRERPY